MFFPGAPLYFFLSAALPAGILIALVILLVAVIGRRAPDPLGRRAEAAYLFSTIFAIGLLGLAAITMTADAVGSGVVGYECAFSGRVGPGQSSLDDSPDLGARQPLELNPIPGYCRDFGRGSAARGVRGAMYLGVAAIGVVRFGNRARELLAKEKSNDS